MARKSKKELEALENEVLTEEKTSDENEALNSALSEDFPSPEENTSEETKEAAEAASLSENEDLPLPKDIETSAEEKDIIEEYSEDIVLFPEEKAEDVQKENEQNEKTQEPIKTEVKEEAEVSEESENTNETDAQDESEVITGAEADENAESEEIQEETDGISEEAQTFFQKPEMTEEEIRDARYLPRESVIFDEYADDAVEYTESGEYSEEEPEIYSLNFFESEEEESENTHHEEEEEPEEKEEPYDPKKPRRIDTRFDFVELFVFTLVFVLFITSFIFRHSVVVGGSMENTLFEGERLLISDLFYTPEYGDIIVFQDTETGIKGAVVKRIIGLPGDVIEVYENGSIYRNGVLLIEEYIFIDGKNPQDNSVFTVGEGEYFVMGDHRNNSEDSRSFGTIKEDSILGRVLFRFYPFERFGKVE